MLHFANVFCMGLISCGLTAKMTCLRTWLNRSLRAKTQRLRTRMLAGRLVTGGLREGSHPRNSGEDVANRCGKRTHKLLHDMVWLLADFVKESDMTAR
jgi:hypothetical protein